MIVTKIMDWARRASAEAYYGEDHHRGYYQEQIPFIKEEIDFFRYLGTVEQPEEEEGFFNPADGERYNFGELHNSKDGRALEIINHYSYQQLLNENAGLEPLNKLDTIEEYIRSNRKGADYKIGVLNAVREFKYNSKYYTRRWHNNGYRSYFVRENLGRRVNYLNLRYMQNQILDRFNVDDYEGMDKKAVIWCDSHVGGKCRKYLSNADCGLIGLNPRLTEGYMIKNKLRIWSEWILRNNYETFDTSNNSTLRDLLSDIRKAIFMNEVLPNAETLYEKNCIRWDNLTDTECMLLFQELEFNEKFRRSHTYTHVEKNLRNKEASPVLDSIIPTSTIINHTIPNTIHIVNDTLPTPIRFLTYTMEQLEHKRLYEERTLMLKDKSRVILPLEVDKFSDLHRVGSRPTSRFWRFQR